MSGEFFFLVLFQKSVFIKFLDSNLVENEVVLLKVFKIKFHWYYLLNDTDLCHTNQSGLKTIFG